MEDNNLDPILWKSNNDSAPPYQPPNLSGSDGGLHSGSSNLKSSIQITDKIYTNIFSSGEFEDRDNPNASFLRSRIIVSYSGRLDLVYGRLGVFFRVGLSGSSDSSDLNSSIFVAESDHLPSYIGVPYKNKLGVQFNLTASANSDLDSILYIGHYSYLPSSILVNYTNKMTANLVQLVGEGSSDLRGSIIITEDNDIESSIYVSHRNKMTADLKQLLGYREEDFLGSIDVTLSSLIHSSIIVRPTNQMEGKFDIYALRHEELPGTIHPRVGSSLNGSILVRARNSMEGLFDTQRPPRVDETLYPIQDTYVKDTAPTTNYGNMSELLVGKDRNGATHRSLVKFNVSSLPDNSVIEKAELVFSPSRISSSLLIEVGTPNEPWSEYGTTWNNQPSRYDRLDAFHSGPNTDEVRMDITTLASLWYSGSNVNNGISLSQALANDSTIKSFMSSETSTSPRLEITYYSSRIDNYDRADLSSSIRVIGYPTEDLKSSIEINSYWSHEDFEGSIDVVDPTLLPSSIIVSSPDLMSTIPVAYFENDDFDSSIYVKLPGISEIESSIHARARTTEDLPGRISVKYDLTSGMNSSIVIHKPADLESSIHPRVESISDLRGRVRVRAVTDDDLVSSIDVDQISDLEGSIEPRLLADSDLIGTLWTKYSGDSAIESSIEVPERDDLISSIAIDGVHYRDTDLESSIHVRAKSYSDLDSVITISDYISSLVSSIEVDPMYDEDNSDIPSSIIVSIPNLNSSIMIVIPGESNLDSSIGVVPYSDLHGQLMVKYASRSELPGFFNIRFNDFDEILSSIEVKEVSDLDSSIDVTGVREDDLDSSIWVRQESEDTLESSMDVHLVSDLDSEILIVVNIDLDLESSIDIKEINDLSGSITVHEISDLESSLVVAVHDTHQLKSSIIYRGIDKDILESSIHLRLSKDINSSIKVAYTNRMKSGPVQLAASRHHDLLGRFQVGKSYGVINLDTTAPDFLANIRKDEDDQVWSPLVDVRLESSDTDIIEMRIWGEDIDVKGNPDIQATEVTSSWIPYDPSIQVLFDDSYGDKSINVRLRDDVWNETEVQTTSVTYGAHSVLVTEDLIGNDCEVVGVVSCDEGYSYSSLYEQEVLLREDLVLDEVLIVDLADYDFVESDDSKVMSVYNTDVGTGFGCIREIELLVEETPLVIDLLRDKALRRVDTGYLDCDILTVGQDKEDTSQFIDIYSDIELLVCSDHNLVEILSKDFGTKEDVRYDDSQEISLNLEELSQHDDCSNLVITVFEESEVVESEDYVNYIYHYDTSDAIECIWTGFELEGTTLVKEELNIHIEREDTGSIDSEYVNLLFHDNDGAVSLDDVIISLDLEELSDLVEIVIQLEMSYRDQSRGHDYLLTKDFVATPDEGFGEETSSYITIVLDETPEVIDEVIDIERIHLDAVFSDESSWITLPTEDRASIDECLVIHHLSEDSGETDHLLVVEFYLEDEGDAPENQQTAQPLSIIVEDTAVVEEYARVNTSKLDESVGQDSAHIELIRCEEGTIESDLVLNIVIDKSPEVDESVVIDLTSREEIEYQETLVVNIVREDSGNGTDEVLRRGFILQDESTPEDYVTSIVVHVSDEVESRSQVVISLIGLSDSSEGLDTLAKKEFGYSDHSESSSSVEINVLGSDLVDEVESLVVEVWTLDNGELDDDRVSNFHKHFIEYSESIELVTTISLIDIEDSSIVEEVPVILPQVCDHSESISIITDRALLFSDSESEGHSKAIINPLVYDYESTSDSNAVIGILVEYIGEAEDVPSEYYREHTDEDSALAHDSATIRYFLADSTKQDDRSSINLVSCESSELVEVVIESYKHFIDYSDLLEDVVQIDLDGYESSRVLSTHTIDLFDTDSGEATEEVISREFILQDSSDGDERVVTIEVIESDDNQVIETPYIGLPRYDTGSSESALVKLDREFFDGFDSEESVTHINVVIQDTRFGDSNVIIDLSVHDEGQGEDFFVERAVLIGDEGTSIENVIDIWLYDEDGSPFGDDSVVNETPVVHILGSDQGTSTEVITDRVFSSLDANVVCESIMIFGYEVDGDKVNYPGESNHIFGDRERQEYINPRYLESLERPMDTDHPDYPYGPANPKYGEVIEPFTDLPMEYSEGFNLVEGESFEIDAPVGANLMLDVFVNGRDRQWHDSQAQSAIIRVENSKGDIVLERRLTGSRSIMVLPASWTFYELQVGLGKLHPEDAPFTVTMVEGLKGPIYNLDPDPSVTVDFKAWYHYSSGRTIGSVGRYIHGDYFTDFRYQFEHNRSEYDLFSSIVPDTQWFNPEYPVSPVIYDTSGPTVHDLNCSNTPTHTKLYVSSDCGVNREWSAFDSSGEIVRIEEMFYNLIENSNTTRPMDYKFINSSDCGFLDDDIVESIEVLVDDENSEFNEIIIYWERTHIDFAETDHKVIIGLDRYDWIDSESSIQDNTDHIEIKVSDTSEGVERYITDKEMYEFDNDTVFCESILIYGDYNTEVRDLSYPGDDDHPEGHIVLSPNIDGVPPTIEAPISEVNLPSVFSATGSSNTLRSYLGLWSGTVTINISNNDGLHTSSKPVRVFIDGMLVASTSLANGDQRTVSFRYNGSTSIDGGFEITFGANSFGTRARYHLEYSFDGSSPEYSYVIPEGHLINPEYPGSPFIDSYGTYIVNHDNYCGDHSGVKLYTNSSCKDLIELDWNLNEDIEIKDLLDNLIGGSYYVHDGKLDVYYAITSDCFNEDDTVDYIGLDGQDITTGNESFRIDKEILANDYSDTCEAVLVYGQQVDEDRYLTYPGQDDHPSRMILNTPVNGEDPIIPGLVTTWPGVFQPANNQTPEYRNSSPTLHLGLYRGWVTIRVSASGGSGAMNWVVRGTASAYIDDVLVDTASAQIGSSGHESYSDTLRFYYDGTNSYSGGIQLKLTLTTGGGGAWPISGSIRYDTPLAEDSPAENHELVPEGWALNPDYPADHIIDAYGDSILPGGSPWCGDASFIHLYANSCKSQLKDYEWSIWDHPELNHLKELVINHAKSVEPQEGYIHPKRLSEYNILPSDCNTSDDYLVYINILVEDDSEFVEIIRTDKESFYYDYAKGHDRSIIDIIRDDKGSIDLEDSELVISVCETPEYDERVTHREFQLQEFVDAKDCTVEILLEVEDKSEEVDEGVVIHLINLEDSAIGVDRALGTGPNVYDHGFSNSNVVEINVLVYEDWTLSTNIVISLNLEDSSEGIDFLSEKDFTTWDRTAEAYDCKELSISVFECTEIEDTLIKLSLTLCDDSVGIDRVPYKEIPVYDDGESDHCLHFDMVLCDNSEIEEIPVIDLFKCDDGIGIDKVPFKEIPVKDEGESEHSVVISLILDDENSDVEESSVVDFYQCDDSVGIDVMPFKEMPLEDTAEVHIEFELNLVQCDDGGSAREHAIIDLFQCDDTIAIDRMLYKDLPLTEEGVTSGCLILELDVCENIDYEDTLELEFTLCDDALGIDQMPYKDMPLDDSSDADDCVLVGVSLCEIPVVEEEIELSQTLCDNGIGKDQVPYKDMPLTEDGLTTQCIFQDMLYCDRSVVEDDVLQIDLSVEDSGIGIDVMPYKDMPLAEDGETDQCLFVGQVMCDEIEWDEDDEYISIGFEHCDNGLGIDLVPYKEVPVIETAQANDCITLEVFVCERHEVDDWVPMMEFCVCDWGTDPEDPGPPDFWCCGRYLPGHLPHPPYFPGDPGYPYNPDDPEYGDPVYPGNPWYPGPPYNPGDPGYPEIGDPCHTGDTIYPGDPCYPGRPLYPGDPGYPYQPGDPGYGQPVYPGDPNYPPVINPGDPDHPGEGGPLNPGDPGYPDPGDEDENGDGDPIVGHPPTPDIGEADELVFIEQFLCDDGVITIPPQEIIKVPHHIDNRWILEPFDWKFGVDFEWDIRWYNFEIEVLDIKSEVICYEFSFEELNFVFKEAPVTFEFSSKDSFKACIVDDVFKLKEIPPFEVKVIERSIEFRCEDIDEN